MPLRRIVSGGQTGVDRAALDSARHFMSLSWGGWCPKGRRSEDRDGQGIPEEYFNQEKGGLVESTSDRYPQRTAWNVRDSDGTMCAKAGKLTRGTQKTILECRIQCKPYWLFDPYAPWTIRATARWVCENRISTLNVAGPRASKNKSIHEATFNYLNSVIYLVWLFDFKGIPAWDLKPKKR